MNQYNKCGRGPRRTRDGLRPQRLTGGGIYMQFERGKPPETPNAPYRAARIKDERWRSTGPGFEPRAGRPAAEFKVIPGP
jgi:hypothetical protein